MASLDTTRALGGEGVMSVRSKAELIPASIAQKLAVRASHADEAVAVGNRAGVIEWANGAWTKITGWPLDELVDKPVTRLLNEIGVDHNVLDFVQSRYLAGLRSVVELPIETPEGRSLWIHLEVEPYRDQSGDVSDFVAVVRDITDQREAERALERHFDSATGLLADPSDALGRLAADAGISARAESSREASFSGHPQEAVVQLSLAAIEASRAFVPITRRIAELGAELENGPSTQRHELAELARRAQGLAACLQERAERAPATPCSLDASELVASCCRAVCRELGPRAQIDMQLIEAPPLVTAPASCLADIVTDLLRLSESALDGGWGTISVTTGVTCPEKPLVSEVYHRSFLGTLDESAPRIFIELHDTAQALTPHEVERLRRGLLPAPVAGRVLGLLGARSLVESIGGELDISSVLGCGTRLLILLPTIASR